MCVFTYESHVSSWCECRHGFVSCGCGYVLLPCLPSVRPCFSSPLRCSARAPCSSLRLLSFFLLLFVFFDFSFFNSSSRVGGKTPGRKEGNSEISLQEKLKFERNENSFLLERKTERKKKNREREREREERRNGRGFSAGGRRLAIESLRRLGLLG